MEAFNLAEKPDELLTEINSTEWDLIPPGTKIKIDKANGGSDIGFFKSSTIVKRQSSKNVGDKILLYTSNNMKKLLRHKLINKIWLVGESVESEEEFLDDEIVNPDLWGELQQGVKIRYKRTDGKIVIGKILYQTIEDGIMIIGMISGRFKWRVKYPSITTIWKIMEVETKPKEEKQVKSNLAINGGVEAQESNEIEKRLEEKIREVEQGITQVMDEKIQGMNEKIENLEKELVNTKGIITQAIQLIKRLHKLE